MILSVFSLPGAGSFKVSQAYESLIEAFFARAAARETLFAKRQSFESFRSSVKEASSENSPVFENFHLYSSPTRAVAKLRVSVAGGGGTSLFSLV